VLEQRDGSALAADLADGGVAAARRWFTSFGSCSVTEPRDDLIALGLVAAAAAGPDGSTHEGNS
jgi:hypothetical protein